MPTLVEIHPVVWAPNGNKQTNKQLSFIYIDKDCTYYSEKKAKKGWPGLIVWSKQPAQHTSIFIY